MNYHNSETIEKNRIRIESILSDIGIDQIRREIQEDLHRSPKRISSKFFYNAEGSRLFEEITDLPEYYPGRTEKSILKAVASDLMRNVENTEIVELGSGDPSKISILFSEIPPEKRKSLIYIPVDVSRAAIEDSAHTLSETFPEIEIDGLVADFIHQIQQIPARKRRIFCFFGSTIGNLEHEEAMEMMRSLGETMASGEELILGLDRIKDEKTLHAAYNDSRGVTANFNKNIINVINELVESNTDQNDFRHLAFFNREKNRIEMHLEVIRNTRIESPHMDEPVFLLAGERIHTENSHKYSEEAAHAFAEAAGLVIQETYTDPKDFFWVIHMRKE